MMTHPSLLMIGSAGRNAGKTEFACRLIRRCAASGPVVGVKITTIREDGGCCPRGGAGCGVCGSLNGDYAIAQEIVAGERHDTERMLQAGASTVYWLRVRRRALAAGVQDLFSRIPRMIPVVCESNSARTVIEPGLFLVLRSTHAHAIKESCLEVVALAEQQVVFDGTGWDLNPDQIDFKHGSWEICRPPGP